MKTKDKFTKHVNAEVNALIKHFKGKDIRMAIPSMLAVIEQYVQVQFPNMRKYAVEEIGFLVRRLKGNKHQSENKNNSEDKCNLKISS